MKTKKNIDSSGLLPNVWDNPGKNTEESVSMKAGREVTVEESIKLTRIIQRTPST